MAQPRILLAATLRWPLAARLAIAFARLGSPVHAWCPPGHPLEKTLAVTRIHAARVLAPLRSLRAALEAAAPDFVIPCDDAAALLLDRLHRHGAPALRSLIERSLGTPSSCALAVRRGDLMAVAQAEGVRAPATTVLDSVASLDLWAARQRFPAVLKSDNSWGGLGVAVVEDAAQARAAFRAMMRPALSRALADLVLRRDPAPVLRWLRGARPVVTAQSFVAGRPANRAVACWQGKVLAGISVVALKTRSPTGPATVVEVIDHAEMSEAARRLVAALGLSGLCGMDFILDAAGAAHLVEVNPRATPISHLRLGPGADLPAALQARLRGAPAPLAPSAIDNPVIAMFPGEWQRDPRSRYLASAFHDVPWAEAALVRDCVDLPWEERGAAARLRARLKSGRAAQARPFPSPGAWPALGARREG